MKIIKPNKRKRCCEINVNNKQKCKRYALVNGRCSRHYTLWLERNPVELTEREI